MENKTFLFKKENGKVKIQIGNSLYTITDAEKLSFSVLFNSIKESNVTFPYKNLGTSILFDNGIIAANINVAKLDVLGYKYLFLVYSLSPETNKYEVSNFIVSNKILDEFLEVLK